MKIIKIEINTGANNLVLENKIILYPVILTIQRWFGLVKPIKLKAYPINYGPTYGSEFVHFFYYVDENGKQFNNDICIQINNFTTIIRCKK